MRIPVKLEASFRSGVSSRPLLHEVPVEEECEPLLATNSMGLFVSTRRSVSRGVARFGFFELPLSEEPSLFPSFYMSLHEYSAVNNWKNRFSNLSDAFKFLGSNSLEPSYLLLPPSRIASILGKEYNEEEVNGLLLHQGYITTLDGARIVPADLHDEGAILTSTPSMVGMYTRVRDYMGVLILRASTSIAIIDEVL